MEEMKTPISCPKTVTVRRNPYRKARETPSSTVPFPLPLSSPSVPPDIPKFPIQDILSVDLPENRRANEPDPPSSSLSPKIPELENLKVFLRIRPLTLPKSAQKPSKNGGDEVKNAWPKHPKTKNLLKKRVKKVSEVCVTVNDSHSVTVSTPNSLQESKRVKSEVYQGFSHVFSDESSQAEVYEKLVHPLVEDFLRGKSGMLAALGPTGSGKTHTVFGCIREPGMVPLALRHIFAQEESNGNQVSRTFYLSMFEISSEKGKSERIFDLLQEAGELYLQQSAIKGLQEVIINDALQAESLVAHGMLRRATAATNSNSQSSRSQCIINICCMPKKIDGEFDNESKSSSLTIVDLAGAEREKKTGNKGLRMLQSNFINNTSMVFGLCLRSLLEHQKNPKKPLQKHFQNSLLTRYLREYLEGKKRMALVLTLRPGEEDYLETSNLLRQASPYAQIKFKSVEEPDKTKCTKRPIQILPRADLKRMKFSSVQAYSINETTDHGDQPQIKEKDVNGNLTEILVESEACVGCEANEGIYIKGGPIQLEKRNREHHIMVNFAKALWNVLKQYKEKLEMAENEICCLRDNLTCEKKRSSDLENEVRDLKSKSSFPDVASVEVGSSFVVATCIGTNSFEVQNYQKDENWYAHSIAENSQDSKDVQAVDMHHKNGAIGVWTASHSGGNERCEAAGPGEHLQDLKDSEKDYSSVSNATNVTDTKNVERDDRRMENEGTDSESATSRSPSYVKTREVRVQLEEEEPAISAATIPDSVVSFSLSPITASGDNFSAVKIDQLSHEKKLDPSVTVRPSEDALPTQNSGDCTDPNIVCSIAACNSQNTEKPKRRLLPASSILLKDIGSLAVEEEIDKPKGARGDKRVAVEMRNKSKGSISLLRLLRNDLHL
ncbi:hypothetical protein ACH5RR_035255 [Cinchona calisaya]|uniref:Kinesin-like protein n=1 Tax=Cinchona calisaya TaxID=153742 RepID=A0ABD2YGI0_9GENT